MARADLRFRAVSAHVPERKPTPRARRRGIPAEGETRAPTPFIKWAGGKRSLVEQIRPYLPARFGRYFEPFVGGAALFFELGEPAREATLSDNNRRLVATYRGLRDHTDEVVRLLKSYPYQRKFFERMRRRYDIDTASDAEVAAWFIYLNKTGYNGLYRVNSKNRFNVPFGRYTEPNICDEPNLRACAQALGNAQLLDADFEEVTRSARVGDLVYFDPPYVPLSATSSFTSYTAEGFGPDDQRRLRDVARRLAQRGVHVLVSNSSAAAVRELYGADFDIAEVWARRSINSKSAGRSAIPELLIRGRTKLRP
jgi:DNA adenine methylase